MFSGASNFSNQVDGTFLFIFSLSVLVLLGIIFAMVYFVVRYNRKKNPYSKNIEGHTALEVTWTVIPLALFMLIFYFGWTGWANMETVPADAVPVKITARMWQWTFDYPNGVQEDTLVVPLGAAIRGDLYSMDVNHAFYVPAFRLKKDVLPNRQNVVWFRANLLGSYDVACAEYCGLRHSYMYTKVVVLDSIAFTRWYDSTSANQGKPRGNFFAASHALPQ